MNTRACKTSDTSVPRGSGDAQKHEMNPRTFRRKRKKSTAGTSSKMKTTPVDHAAHMDNNGDDNCSEATVAPTAFLSVKKNHLLKAKKKKKHIATEKNSNLTKERYCLLQQLGKNDGKTIDTSSSDNSSPDASSSASSSSPSNSSSSSSSRSSSSSTDSSDSDKKAKNRRKKKKKHKKKEKRKKKWKKKEQHGKQRARQPKEVIKRYRKVLKAYKKEGKLSAAYRKVGVDRNTIVTNAPICELAVVAPEKYKELLLVHTPQQRLQDFAKKCLQLLIDDPNLLKDVERQKNKGKLIPLFKKA